MTDDPTPVSDEWSAPVIHGEPQVYEPRMYTEADPISQVLQFDWADVDETAGPHWGASTLVGKRRFRRASERARDVIVDEDGGGTVVVGEVSPPDEDAPDEAAPGEPVEPSDRGLLADSRTMAVASLASRITGFLRSSLLVAALGIGQVGNAYNVANNFPNMVYELLLGGVLSSVLIPLLVHAQEEDSDNGVAYTQRLLSIATAALGAMTLLAVVLAPVISAGFVGNHSQRDLTSLFATLLLPEIFFYGLGAMFMAVLNVRHSYGPGAWSPVLNNVVMIVTLGIFWALPGPNTLTPSSITTPQIVVLGLGTTLGIAAQALVLIPALRQSGFRWQWRFRARPNESGRMSEVGTLAGWVFGYVVASQIGVTVIAKVGVSHDAFAAFTYADLLLQMPYGILVVSLLTALMPRLSRAAVRGEIDAVKDDLNLGARLSAVALVPITAGLIVLGPVLNVVLFAYGETSVSGARIIGVALAASAFGLFPFAIVMLQLRVFYAMRDGRTPTLINIYMVGSKVLIVLVCNAIFDTQKAIAISLTVATSASYVIGAVVGHITLTRRVGRLGFNRVFRTVTQIGVASVVGALVALALVLGIDAGLGGGHAGSLVGLIVGGVVGLAVMGAVAVRMRIPEFTDVLDMVGWRR